MIDQFADEPIIQDARAAHTLGLNEDIEFPGLAFFSDGKREINLRREQEKYMFAVRQYFLGYVVPQWRVRFDIWKYSQVRLANALIRRYAPYNVKSLGAVRFHTFTNPFLNDAGFHAGLISSWTPIGTPQKGLVLSFEIALNDDYPLAWPPAPKDASKKEDDKAQPLKFPQPTDAEINPDPRLQIPARIEDAMKGRREPGEAYKIFESWGGR